MSSRDEMQQIGQVGAEIKVLLDGYRKGEPLGRSADLLALAKEVVAEQREGGPVDIEGWAHKLAESVAGLTD